MTATTYNSPTLSHSDTLLTALFLAAIVHAVILVGINFSIPQPAKINRSIEITLSSTPAKKAPDNAKYLAQNNQIGAGSTDNKPEPPQQKLPNLGNGQKQSHATNDTPSTPKALSDKLTTESAPESIASADKLDTLDTIHEIKPRISAEVLQRQIAQLGEQIRQSQPSSELSRIKFVNAISAHQYIAAQYMKDWEDKVERTGNLNYPEVARKKGFSGSLTMDVGIKADGSIYNLRITKSSGNQALDDAAKRIVRMSTPFSSLPDDLLEELDVLVITRVWKFSDESGMTTR